MVSQWSIVKSSHELVLSVDRIRKKVWAIPNNAQLGEVCRWDLKSGQLEFKEKIGFGRDAKLSHFAS